MHPYKFDSIICFGGEDWWYHNRGHIDMQLMRRFAQNGTVLYVNSIVMQKPNLSQGRTFLKKLIRKAKSIFTGLKMSDAGFWVYSPFALPVQHIAWLRPLNEIILRGQLWLVTRKLEMRDMTVWVACPAACHVALKMKKSKLVYQRTDRFEDTPNVDARKIEEIDRRLKVEADLTIFVNKSLYDEEFYQCRRALYLDHGVDFELFASAHLDSSIPDDIKCIQKPIVGYFGGVADHKVDVELIRKLVKLLPELSFVFVGEVPRNYRELLTGKNVWFLGQKPYEQIPHYGKCFDIAIFPWRVSRWTKAANPIKLKEYLALGKPVVSTPFTELQKYRDVVYQAKTPEDFAQVIEKALAEDNDKRIVARRKMVMNTTWDSKAQIVLNELSIT